MQYFMSFELVFMIQSASTWIERRLMELVAFLLVLTAEESKGGKCSVAERPHCACTPSGKFCKLGERAIMNSSTSLSISLRGRTLADRLRSWEYDVPLATARVAD